MILDVARMLGHSIVSSRLDYTNALLHCTSSNLSRLQVSQKSLVRVCRASLSASIGLLLSYVNSSIGFLVSSSPTDRLQAIAVILTRHDTQALRLTYYLIHDYLPTRTLGSSDKLLLSVGLSCTALALSTKAFSVSAPSDRNSLLYNCRSSALLNTVKRTGK